LDFTANSAIRANAELSDRLSVNSFYSLSQTTESLMAKIYIRTPDHDSSRGPFDIAKLQTLAEAGQIDLNTLYYDEEQQEWIPIAIKQTLRAAVFPQRKKLKLKTRAPKVALEDNSASSGLLGEPAGRSTSIKDLLNAAASNAEQRSQLQKSSRRGSRMSPLTLAIMMFGSATTFCAPHLTQIKNIFKDQNYATLLNHPLLLLGLIDALLAILLLFAVTEIYPIIRSRAMLLLSSGCYLGWAMSDPHLIGLSLAAGLAMFLLTVSRNFTCSLIVSIIGCVSSGYLAYLAINGYFSNFFSSLQLQIISD